MDDASRPASRPNHSTKGMVDEIVFGHDLDCSSMDISPDEIYGWGGAGLGSKALQALTMYLLRTYFGSKAPKHMRHTLACLIPLPSLITGAWA